MMNNQINKQKKLICAYCLKRVKNSSIPDHFNLWTRKKNKNENDFSEIFMPDILRIIENRQKWSVNRSTNEIYITFHFECAFRKPFLKRIAELNGVVKDLLEDDVNFENLTGIDSLPNDFQYCYDFNTKKIF